MTTSSFAATDTNSLWNIVPGWSDATAVSLEAVDHPGWYMKHGSYLLSIGQVSASSASLTKQDATWSIVPGLYSASSGYISLESYNFPTYYARHSSGNMRVDSGLTTSLPMQDASWLAVSVPV